MPRANRPYTWGEFLFWAAIFAAFVCLMALPGDLPAPPPIPVRRTSR